MKNDHFTLPQWHWLQGQHKACPLIVYIVADLPKLTQIPQADLLKNVIRQRKMELNAALKEGILATDSMGTTFYWVSIETQQEAFQVHSALAKVVKQLHSLSLEEVALEIVGENAKRIAATVLYVALVNNAQLVERKAGSKKVWRQIYLKAPQSTQDLCQKAALLANANTLTRYLTVKAPNELNPVAYRKYLKEFSRSHKLDYEEWDEARLQKIGAGAFLSVSQGSNNRGAAIVKISYRPKRAKNTIALVGKGICFDTGGHNLKPARYMHNMHEDMNGSAVVLGILKAALDLSLDVAIDAWFAIAENHLSPNAYKQNDVVTALNGVSIEIVHTDAEGRMVLADTLTLAEREKPNLIIDFATLTGSMHVALGARMSGIFVNRPEMANLAVEVGQLMGERVVCFPAPSDYDEALSSQVADVKQCTLTGEADHILAVRFLSKFINHTPWIHMDLSASRNEGGLGALLSDVTGFGVLWGAQFIDSWGKKEL
ncbi:MAG: leucyl aminopeptidase family protein [Betaproteobacteria bacterium]|nr:leucyl aminopeptidase family protein [Betaproteobacteria bacterium]